MARHLPSARRTGAQGTARGIARQLEHLEAEWVVGPATAVNQPGAGRFEMPLVAEGRKLGMLARLISTGSLGEKGCLFWDEPEANLNPKLVRDVARAILGLCESGVQVVVATHSPFLLREFDMLGSGFRDVTPLFRVPAPAQDAS